MENGDQNSTTKASSIKSEDIKDLKEILEIKKLSRLLEQFYSATGVANFIVDLKGNILHGVGWKSICTDFHRKHEISSERCLRSDTILANQLKKKDKHAIYICQNGMVDVATPIIIDGIHVANLFIGQFFFETPDKDYFIKQAKELGFDKEKYMKALEECHVYNKETILKFLDFFSELINMVGDSALKTIKQKKQEEEKADRAAELLIADEELAFQTGEKADRAAELVIADEELIKSEKRYKTLTQTSIDGFFILDFEGGFLEVNDVYYKTSGYSREDLLSMNIKDIDLDEDVKQIDEHMEKIVVKGWDQFESRHRKKDGTVFHVNNSITFIPEEKTFICFLHDITVRKKAEKDLLYMISHDYLTDLYNRRFFEEALIKLDTEENLPISIIMSDVNGLKLVNDSFGHTIGDDFLKKTAEIIKKACREDDIVARLGGDEFAVILPKTDSVETQQILDCIKNLTLDVKIANVELSISVGDDTKIKQEQSIVEILANAENYMYKHKLNERSSMRSKTIDLIMKTLFEKSNREMLHSKRVSGISEAIATKMNYDKDEIGQIRIAGLVHDIGKIGIDEKILNKNGKPDDVEWKQIGKHPEMGWRILSSTNEFSELANIVIAHHEKWDGSGYPNGIKGEEIPLKARIIAVADAYDAMTSERSYRKALDKNASVEELKRCSGTQFDPKIVDVFLNLVLPFNSTFAL